MPKVYIEYLIRTVANFYIETYSEDKRFNSLTGSIGIGFTSSAMILISSYFYSTTKKKVYIFYYYLSLIITVLTFQRAAFLLSLIAYMFSHFIWFRNKNIRKLVIFESLIILPIFILFFINYLNYTYFIERILTFSTSVSERSHQWNYIWSQNINLLVGNGIGSMSHHARGYSPYLINDGGYHKILAETGIIGLLLFILIVAYSLFGMYKKPKNIHNLTILAIIVFYLMYTYISNIIFFIELSSMFWFLIGKASIVNGKDENNENSCYVSATISRDKRK